MISTILAGLLMLASPKPDTLYNRLANPESECHCPQGYSPLVIYRWVYSPGTVTYHCVRDKPIVADSPKPVDTVMEIAYPSWPLSEMKNTDTASEAFKKFWTVLEISGTPYVCEKRIVSITYHSLSQLPKDTTLRWDVKVAWKWGRARDSVFHKEDCGGVRINQIITRYQRDKFDSLKTVWRFVPDSA